MMPYDIDMDYPYCVISYSTISLSKWHWPYHHCSSFAGHHDMEVSWWHPLLLSRMTHRCDIGDVISPIWHRRCHTDMISVFVVFIHFFLASVSIIEHCNSIKNTQHNKFIYLFADTVRMVQLCFLSCQAGVIVQYTTVLLTRMTSDQSDEACSAIWPVQYNTALWCMMQGVPSFPSVTSFHFWRASK